MQPEKCNFSDIIITPDHLDFEMQEGSSFNPPTQDLFLKKDGPGLSATWDAEVTTQGPQVWLKLSPASGSVPKRVRVYCKSMGMPKGEWNGEIKIHSHVKVIPSVIPVKLVVKGEEPPEPPPEPPEPPEPPPEPPEPPPEPPEPPPEPPEKSCLQRLIERLLDFFSKKKKQAKREPDDIQLDAAIIKLAVNYGITRIDWLITAVEVLFQMFPDAEQNAKIIDYRRRYKEFEAERDKILKEKD